MSIRGFGGKVVLNRPVRHRYLDLYLNLKGQWSYYLHKHQVIRQYYAQHIYYTKQKYTTHTGYTNKDLAGYIQYLQLQKKFIIE